ncbi:MAG TPA: hypothetical protein VHS08_04905, partial [Candidatus Acidoferrales bacterium]|nr:hypothetical protein [Candidatus Acidoferrales bacterium]
MRAIVLAAVRRRMRRRCAIFRSRRWCGTHVVASLPSPVVGIFARHRTVYVTTVVLRTVHVTPIVLRTVHVAPVVLRTVHLTRLSLGTRYSAIHVAIVGAAVNRTVIYAMVGYRSRYNRIMSAEFSGPRSGCDGRSSMVHRCQKFSVSARSVFVLDLPMRSFKVT